jgi:hypothetical protein
MMIFALFTMSSLSGENGILHDTYFLKQSVFIFISILALIIVSFFDYRFLRDSYIVTSFYLFSLSLLILLFPFGYTVNGAKA